MNTLLALKIIGSVMILISIALGFLTFNQGPAFEVGEMKEVQVMTPYQYLHVKDTVVRGNGTILINRVTGEVLK